MKFIYYFLCIFFVLPLYAQEDITGKWAYSGSGCRDVSFNPDSHRSASSEFSQSIESAIFTFNDDNEVSATTTLKSEESDTVSSDYTFDGSVLVIKDWDEAKIKLVNNRLIIHTGDNDDDSECKTGEVFVYVIARIN
ncbi:MAG: hypothetical protein OXM55_01800 [Bdellovibrionales bacterium]|nr:hypothetical protein [Bdellovibrionales bacterium]